MKKLVIKSKDTNEILYEKELCNIAKIETVGRDFKITSCNGFNEYYYKSRVELIIE